MRTITDPRLLLLSVVLLAGTSAALAQEYNDIFMEVFRHSDQDCAEPPEGPDGTTGLPFEPDDPFHAPRVIFVDQAATGENTGLCWLDAFVDLQDALALARSGTIEVAEIWVAAGTYRPDRGTLNRSKSFRLVEGVKLLGGFDGTETRKRQRNSDPITNGTILSGDLLGDDVATASKVDNSFHVLRGKFLTSDTVVDGFQILGGFADGSDGNAAQMEGGGIRLTNSGPVLRRLLFYDNLAFTGGALYLDRSNPLIRYVGFLQNGAIDGGAIYGINNSLPTVELSNLWQNFAVENGGGVLLENADMHVTHTRFLVNTAKNGGAVQATGSKLSAINVIFSGNTASENGGGLRIVIPQETMLMNCTLATNSAQLEGGGLQMPDSGLLELSNTILWGNTALGGASVERQQVGVGGGAALTVQHTTIEGWTGEFGGPHNDGFDPLLIDPSGALSANLGLADGSPAIDSGHNLALADAIIQGRNASPANLQIDVDLLPRFVDDPDTVDTGVGQAPVVDRGASEYQAASSPDPP